MDDFLGDLLNVGAERGGWRSPWAIAGLILVACPGGWLGYAGGDILGAMGGIATGGFFGWIGFVMLTGLIPLAPAAFWVWLTT